MLGRLFSAYEGALLRRPLATKCAMSMAVLGTADACAQRLQHHNNPPAAPKPSDGGGSSAAAPGFELDLRRQSAVAVYSLGFQGPFGHFWYNLLEHRVAPALPKRYVVAAKVACDQLVNALASNVLYFSFIPWFEGKPVDEIRQKLRMDLGPTCFPCGKTAAERLRPIRPPARTASSGRPPASASLGQLTDMCWLASTWLPHPILHTCTLQVLSRLLLLAAHVVVQLQVRARAPPAAGLQSSAARMDPLHVVRLPRRPDAQAVRRLQPVPDPRGPRLSRQEERVCRGPVGVKSGPFSAHREFADVAHRANDVHCRCPRCRPF